MEAKDTKKYGKELSIIGRKLNDLGARCALRYENDEQTLEDICKVGEDVFEISFKAGQEDVMRLTHPYFQVIAKHWKQVGIKEVVEWITEHSPIFITGGDIADCAGHEIPGDTSYYPVIKWLEWQAKLKEWGI